MVRQGWDWYMGSKMVTTTYFLVMSGYKFGLAQTHFSHPDWVCSDWFRQFTASQPLQSFTISILNGKIKLRLEFIYHNHHYTRIFESWVVRIWIQGPYVSQQVWACRDWISHFISAQPIQSLIISIMNGYTWFRLVYGLWNGHRKTIFWSWVGTNLAWTICSFAPKLSVYWLIQAIHSISTLPIFSPWVCCMIRHGWDWNSSPTTITTPQLLSRVGGEKFGYNAPAFRTKFECVQTDSAISYQLNPSNLSL